MSWFTEMARTPYGYVATCPICGEKVNIPPVTPEESRHWYFGWAGRCPAARAQAQKEPVAEECQQESSEQTGKVAE